MSKIIKKDIVEICNEIDLIIAGTNNRADHKYTFLHLHDVLNKKISYNEIVLICKTTLKIAKTKNRAIRHLEKNFWDFINDIPLYFFWIQGLDISKNEELLPNIDYDNMSKKILSRLIGLAQEVLELKDDNSKGSDLRRAGSIGLLAKMINYYHIPIAKNLFVNSINSKNKGEQYAALEGLINFYDVSNDEIEDDLVKLLDNIKKQTDDRTVASTCLQIQINAGIINEMTAVFEIDDWKNEHYK